LDKNPVIRTVINKTLDVGTESEFRTFPYEVLAGKDDLDVLINDCGCIFKFNFGKVYWNTRLEAEHERLVSKFKEGEAVCDVMAGVGPFAVRAGKQMVFVHANDLNPDSYYALKWAIDRNKVSDFVIPYCEDGRDFIRKSTQYLARYPREIHIVPKKIRTPRGLSFQERLKIMSKSGTRYSEPRIFSHYVMNLPASAVEFLNAFRGLFRGRESEFTPSTLQKLPLIHVYLFQRRLDKDENERAEIRERVAKHLGIDVEVLSADPELEVHYSRLVSPKKKMYCASFRLPAQVAYSDFERGYSSSSIKHSSSPATHSTVFD
jgi:tRNA (guanine37-N1)-methyltransferase